MDSFWTQDHEIEYKLRLRGTKFKSYADNFISPYDICEAEFREPAGKYKVIPETGISTWISAA